MKFTAKKSQPLLNLLKSQLPECSNNYFKSIIKNKRLSINTSFCSRIDLWVEEGSLIEIHSKKKLEEIAIVFEDSQMVVVDKEKGLLSVADDRKIHKNLHSLLKARRPKSRVYPIHRLDRDTSGLIMFAYTPIAREFLKEELKQRRVKREYRAIVEGKLEKKKGIWKDTLLEDANLFMRSSINGQLAITQYEVLRESALYTELRIQLGTGRKNQIRVQASLRGHPVVGDLKYGSSMNPFHRLALHAKRLSFTHPISKKLICLESRADEKTLPMSLE